MLKLEVYEDEAKIIEVMRKFGPYVSFMIEKKPSKERPQGELVRIETTHSIKIRTQTVEL